MKYEEFHKLPLEKQMEKFREGYAIWFCIHCHAPTLQKPGWECTECGFKYKQTR